MAPLLSRFPLKLQIGSLILLAGIVLVLCATVLWTTRNSSAEMARLTDREGLIARQAALLDATLLNARRHEKDFLLRRDAHFVAAHGQAIAAAGAALDAIAGAVPPGDARQVQVTALRQGIATYAESFGKVAALETNVGLTENDGLLGALRGSVHEVEAILQAHQDLRLQVSMLMMRRHEKDFFARIDAKYIDALVSEGETFRTALDGSSVPAAERADISDRMTAYQRDVKAAATAVLASTAAAKAMGDSYTAIQPVIETLVTEAQTRIAALSVEAGQVALQGDRIMVAVMLIGFFVLLAIGSLVARSIYRPLIAMTLAMQALAAGDTEAAIPGAERRDEVGGMARSVQIFRQAMLDADTLRTAQQQDRVRAEQEKIGALQAMADTVEGETGEAVTQVAAEGDRVNETVGRMAQSALRVEDNAQRVAAAAQQSLANAQAVAGASEQLSASIREIASQVARSKAIVGATVDAAGTAAQTATGLAEAMAAIDQVVQVIASIAGQTNLLALNATIEAARAGEAGKGFAVVANEVKGLANQTARQTQDITARITTLKAMADQVGSAIGSVVEHIRGVEEIAGSVAAAVEQQDAATNEIARNVAQSAQAAQEVTDHIVAVADEAAATGQQAQRVETQLGAMAQRVGALGHVLTKVVRTATGDVDRRKTPRYAIKARAKVELGGTEIAVELVDISLGGAGVTGLPPGCEGQSCLLKIDALRLPAKVVRSGHGIAGLTLDPGCAALVGRWIAQQAETARAA